MSTPSVMRDEANDAWELLSDKTPSKPIATTEYTS